MKAHGHPKYDRWINHLPLPWHEEYHERVTILMADEPEPISDEREDELREKALRMVQANIDRYWAARGKK